MGFVRVVALGVVTVAAAGASACAGSGSGGTGSGGSSGAKGGPHAALVARIDSIVEAPIKAGKVVGASVAVVKGRDTIVAKAYGLANLELDVPTPPNAIYEIGSVTKQFTGAAIMQLVEQGKISLDDDIKKYLPTYNTQGRKIVIRQLLDHTSGIKGYTEIPEFRQFGAYRLSRDTLIGLFSKKPFDFEPGDEEIYNNSAFYLAGLIIEKVSGQSYEDYVQKNLFDRAGMTHSHYCSESKVYKNKVSGYDSDSAGPVLKGPLSHIWPYAAGSLCASALDLVRWNEALHREGKILGAAAYQTFITPDKLNDGTTIGYAKGIATYDRLGRRALHHGGGINGFLSQNTYFPNDSLSVVVLFNTAGPGSPDAAAQKIAEVVLGAPASAAKSIDGDAARFAGTYTGRGRGRPMELTVSVDGGNVKVRFPGADSAETLTYLGDNVFVRDEARLIFVDQGGKIAKLRLDAGYANNVLTRK